MAKIYGIAGKVTGKIANQVFAVVKGVNVVREYNGQPANPQTTLQVASRARLKLLSQFAAAMAPLIAYKREGLKSPRNLFIKGNYELSSYNTQTEVADIDMLSISLSEGLVGLPAIRVEERTANTLTVELNAYSSEYDFIQYGGVIVDPTGKILQIPPKRVDYAGQGPEGYQVVFSNLHDVDSGVIYAIGFRLNDDASKAKYAQITAAQETASVLVTRVLSELNLTKTVTRSVGFDAYQAP